ncbi:MAG TPA: 16S rRNA (adenine(1518)-N(6)/adenine(1519)-N(6))-dimethyltransferase RsmA [Bacilli bacterium]|nr:16S rRNA (adenine(1518)-N(6)/adenine(1519)-N(6))-dimethyltransferase RsmA [Bacilli bacterium]
MSIKETEYLIKKYDLKIKKQYGQNFLVNDNIVKKIAETIEAEPKATVIEIGPGLGALTKILSQRFDKVLCYEIDSQMVDILNRELKSDNIYIFNRDFLKSNLGEDIKQYAPNDRAVVIANLPYYITTPILTKILEEAPFITEIAVMMQKEVADRICGKPSTKDYNSLSVLIQYLTVPKKLFNISPKSFIPAPDVESSVVLIKRKETLFPEVLDMDYFYRFNRAIFQQRRKTIVNNLASFMGYAKETVAGLLKEECISENVRAESLAVEQIVKLANRFYRHDNL